MYTSALAMPPRPPLPAVTPVALAALLGAAAMLATAHLAPVGGHAEGFFGAAWAAAAGLFALVVARSRRRGLRGPRPAWLLLVAATATAAFLVRRGDAALVHAVMVLPSSAPLLGPLDVSEALMGLLLVLPAAAVSTSGAVRGPRPGLLIPALAAIAWVGWVLHAAGPRVAPIGGDAFPRLSAAAALMWTATLVGPAALPLPPGRRRVASAWGAALVGAGLILVLGGTVESKAHLLRELPALGTLGRSLGLPYGAGTHVASGAQAVVCFLAAQAALLLATRAAVRSLPAARPTTPLVLAGVAWVAALWCTEATLLAVAGILGWASALLGVDDGPSESPE